jgi:hypothetical protein
MNTTSLYELLERVDDFIAALEQDENRFYVAIDLAHQLRDELSQTIELAE